MFRSRKQLASEVSTWQVVVQAHVVHAASKVMRSSSESPSGEDPHEGQHKKGTRPDRLAPCGEWSQLCRSTMYPLSGARTNPATLQVSSTRSTRLDPPACKAIHAGRTMPTLTMKNDLEKNSTTQSRYVACISNSLRPALQEAATPFPQARPSPCGCKAEAPKYQTRIGPFHPCLRALRRRRAQWQSRYAQRALKLSTPRAWTNKGFRSEAWSDGRLPGSGLARSGRGSSYNQRHLSEPVRKDADGM